MLKDFFRSKYFFTILFSAFSVLLLLIFLRTSNKTPSLVSTSPPTGYEKLSVVKGITLVFSAPVDVSALSATSTPQADYAFTSNGEYNIVLTPIKPLTQNTVYTINLLYQNRPLKTLNYKTEETQTDYEIINKIKDEIARDFPLAHLIPYETESYKVIYSSPLTLEITLKNNVLTKDQAVEQVKSWVKERGGDVEKHKYIVVPLSQN